ncbi:MAG: GAF domain-containing protein [Candidatus Marinimicrobia bacterium]|jgi:HD-GYP domain-containing protein (c-di-GMP phosphodiesterase class II)|nr:GAF domain-containing protein [Candidatus Neomarinimicrobiota bacterium]MBT3496278.1 GAF domain-containing protein [Candidatus Neomarinimicrobiota bacterium]MBT3691615.1 GAF domain-containing protein [Candidatus Neomarinimicrobiota bacterium]MBT3732353.1 GAF domain-containing protein [Candidatus Neomarinimicrobiota bacterium]MBT4144929.1 GAF domain-containing protein [Candidatus Neomarinimicrobiota bacterium]
MSDIDQLNQKIKILQGRIVQLNEIGVALSSEKNTDKLFEMILESGKTITNADGRTLYMKNSEGNLDFKILLNDTMETHMGGTSSVEISFYPVKLHLPDGSENHTNVSAHVALTGEIVHIEDAYTEEGFDFSGTKAFDEKSGYRSKSFLNVPLKNHENDIIGVMQLINARDSDGNIIPFSDEMQNQVESIASQGAVALTNKRLVEELKILFEAFIKLIAVAIDKKSPYTGGHCERVPVITMMLADAVQEKKTGKYKDFSMTDEERYELNIAAWLHDCGKVATPPHVVDKSTKLETIYDRIGLVNTRFEVLRRDAEISYLKERLAGKDASKAESEKIESTYKNQLKQLNEDQAFIERINIGGEFMEQGLQDRVVQISKYPYTEKGSKIPFLSEEEIENLNIKKGTLTEEERTIINDHIVITIDMLEKLPYPKQLKNVPEFAGGHHEKLDGTGYPKGLKDEDMSVQAKMMAIADIFEALTAEDRPYKDGKKLSQAMRIMGFMRNDSHIDPDLFEIFVTEGIYKKYAKQYVNESQIDTVNEIDLLPN